MRRRLAYTASPAVAVRVQRRQIHQDLVAVIPLVGDDFLDHAGVLVCRRGHRFEVLGGRRHRVRDGRGIPWSAPWTVTPTMVPVRLEFPMLSLHPGLRPRGVAPDVWPTLSRA